MKQYRNYVFDLYGTLVDIRTDETDRKLWEHMSLFYGYYGAQYEAEELHQAYLTLVNAKEKALKQENAVQYSHESYPEIPIEEVFTELYEVKGVKPDSQLVIHTGQMFRAHSTKYIRLYAHAGELLTALKEADRGVYLLSNAQRIFTEYELFYLGIHDLFDGILISSDYGCKKPDERFYKILAEKYGVSAAESLMIGNDMDTDIAGAARAGMDSFYIRSAISPHAQTAVGTKHTHADYVMSRMNLLALKNRLLATDR
ncbi:MAG: HAD family hydrolase [Lachnospiraceae bacterium]|nr:HAD family hydrolase [Lachnospiraceae bacterium]